MTKIEFEKYIGREISDLDWAKVVEPMWLSSVIDKDTFLKRCGGMMINHSLTCDEDKAEGRLITCIVVIDDRAKGVKDGGLNWPCSMTLRVDHKDDNGMRYCELLECSYIRKGDEANAMCVFRLSNRDDAKWVKETLCDLQGHKLDLPKMFKRVIEGGYVKMDRS